jgi:hypothetical protein
VEVSARARRALLTTLGVVTALVVVAVASRGSTSGGDGRVRDPGDTLLDILFTLYILAIVAGAVLFFYLLALSRRIKREAGQLRRRSLLELVLTALFVAAFMFLAARRFDELERRPQLFGEEDVVVGTAPAVTTTATQTGPSRYEAEVAWLPMLATAGLVLLAVAAWWFSRRARRRARGELRPALATEIARAVDESLDDLRAEPDPRRAVIAAYARLERVLAAHDLPRRAAEAPLEYLARMLSELDVSERAARTLTDLFERAKFSQHAVEPEMKEQAIAALETVRD